MAAIATLSESQAYSCLLGILRENALRLWGETAAYGLDSSGAYGTPSRQIGAPMPAMSTRNLPLIQDPTVAAISTGTLMSANAKSDASDNLRPVLTAGSASSDDVRMLLYAKPLIRALVSYLDERSITHTVDLNAVTVGASAVDTLNSIGTEWNKIAAIWNGGANDLALQRVTLAGDLDPYFPKLVEIPTIS